ncbi:acyl-CoA thioester hydrolase/BAAT C-terminal domain-containing protein [Streptomyces sp. SL13]|uniref:Acyl-CoA thioester hydrolase/BAAT C-terminal domain-containing protein n=1 Tax=Streptantibioticus silvisoli TaxID=2705255 RepID=A0AA90K7C4_9ACTN|nr:acyl-CoA thioester hydrolase/BAAT C-terminal domain-containing protein [Streptantibioticus silvisoli]MDI5961545.1 acyl-CoA thioester hydrolase/BAAT C-terminal domain-containing protein [Streptantibioticus silvisoli]MDI5968127.1 acyl-CoA thioester hydrolase/BAAT C-terminal domain-containing protein [Streptantibioticus silvisoli]
MPDPVERETTAPWPGLLVRPAGGAAAGVLVLSGSSGRLERERARLLARAGLVALAIRWFGGPGQSPGICEIPLETFAAGLATLRAHGAGRVGVLGVSKGAEAALALAVRDPSVDAVVALSPTGTVWGNVGPGTDGASRPYRSCWTWRGVPLPFVPPVDGWTPDEPQDGPVSILGWYERSLLAYADRAVAARLRVEDAAADLLLVAGGDDLMWPSLPAAKALAVGSGHGGRRRRLRLR